MANSPNDKQIGRQMHQVYHTVYKANTRVKEIWFPGEELNKQFASALILFDCVYSCLYYMLSDEINMFKLKRFGFDLQTK